MHLAPFPLILTHVLLSLLALRPYSSFPMYFFTILLFAACTLSFLAPTIQPIVFLSSSNTTYRLYSIKSVIDPFTIELYSQLLFGHCQKDEALLSWPRVFLFFSHLGVPNKTILWFWNEAKSNDNDFQRVVTVNFAFGKKKLWIYLFSQILVK